MTLKIIKVIVDDIIQYHIVRCINNSLVDIELTYGRAWVRALVYENLEK